MATYLIAHSPDLKRPKGDPYYHPRYLGDIKPIHFSTSKRSKIAFDLINEYSKKAKKEIRRLQEMNRYLHHKIDTMKDLIEKLKEKIKEQAEAPICNHKDDAVVTSIELLFMNTNL